MKLKISLTLMLLLSVLMVCFCLFSCEKKKGEGKAEITDQQFTIRQNGDFNWTIDATGKVHNSGETDLKNVVVTGYCRSCGEILVGGVWYVSDIEKMPEQKYTINYLPAGAEEKFSFQDIAFYFDQTRKAPEILPDKLEVVVESFEVVEK